MYSVTCFIVKFISIADNSQFVACKISLTILAQLYKDVIWISSGKVIVIQMFGTFVL